MVAPPSGPGVLYAVVPAAEAPGIADKRGARAVCWGDLAGLFGAAPPCREPRQAAVVHDGVVRAALEACSSVVPFRLGVALASDDDLRELLCREQEVLALALERLRHRVEMGLKARLDGARSNGRGPLPFDLAAVHALAPSRRDRREGLWRRRGAVVFAGGYLIDRASVERFWAAIAAIRGRLPGLPLCGSGPWAAYSFADLVLPAQTRVARC